MAKIISFPPQPGKYEEIANDWFYEGARCKANMGTPDDEERACIAFAKKYPGDNVTADRCHCLLCVNLEINED